MSTGVTSLSQFSESKDGRPYMPGGPSGDMFGDMKFLSDGLDFNECLSIGDNILLVDWVGLGEVDG